MTARAGRTYTLVLGIGAAGLLIWIATRIGEQSTWRYWATLGVLAGAGLAFAVTQRVAYGAWAEVTPLGFLIAFVAGVICVGWIATFGQPHGNWFRSHAHSWSGDLGITGFVEHMTRFVSVLAFGFGALLASAPGAIERVREPVAVAEPAVRERPAPAVDGPPAPVTGDGDRTVVRPREHARV